MQSGEFFEEEASLSSPNVIAELFTPEFLRHAIQKISGKFEDSPSGFVRQPIRAHLLSELGDDLSEYVAKMVSSGEYRPDGAYFCTIQKRSGASRELVFPSIIDTIVTRHIIDQVEGRIIFDDGDSTFSGRTSSSTANETGEYDNWTDKYKSYALQIRQFAKEKKFSYVFHTDISDFYPSIEKTRAKQALAAKTAAHPSLIELLFFVLENWLPRFKYSQMSGLPVDDQDVSRMIAHCFLKPIDRQFQAMKGVKYVRWVDDTSILTDSEVVAQEVRTMHQFALREIGLSTNASKTQIIPTEQIELHGNYDFHDLIDELEALPDETVFSDLCDRWYSAELDAPYRGYCDKITKRLYSAAIKNGFEIDQKRVVSDLARTPVLASSVARYIIERSEASLLVDQILPLSSNLTLSVDIQFFIGRILGNAATDESLSPLIAKICSNVILSNDSRLGCGASKAIFVSALVKHGGIEDLNRLLESASDEPFWDEQLLLHLNLVGQAFEILPMKFVEHVKRHSRENHLYETFFSRIRDNRLQDSTNVILRCFNPNGKGPLVQAEHLPLLSLLVRHKVNIPLQRRCYENFDPEKGGVHRDRRLITWMQHYQKLLGAEETGLA